MVYGVFCYSVLILVDHVLLVEIIHNLKEICWADSVFWTFFWLQCIWMTLLLGKYLYSTLINEIHILSPVVMWKEFSSSKCSKNAHVDITIWFLCISVNIFGLNVHTVYDSLILQSHFWTRTLWDLWKFWCILIVNCHFSWTSVFTFSVV